MVDKERLFDHCFERDIMAKEMEAVVVAYCGYFGFPDTEKEALVGLVEALKKVRQMEPSLMIRIAISWPGPGASLVALAMAAVESVNRV